MQRGLLGEWTLVAVILALALAAAAGGRWLGRLDQSLYDLAIGAWRRVATPEVLIVAIDDPSLAAIGRWPWPRGVHATVLDRIADGAPAVVGLDLILSEADEQNPRADAALARAIARSPTVLPVYVSGNSAAGLREMVPAPHFVNAARRLGHIDAEIDADGFVRRVFLQQGIGAASRAHFSVAALQLAHPNMVVEAGERRAPRPTARDSLVRDQSYLIPFAGPPGAFERVSFAAVLRGEVAPARFANRIVLIGATAAGLGDAYPTPVSGEGVSMPGIEITANAIDSLLHGFDVREATPLTQIVCAPLAVLGLLGLFLWLTPRAALIATLAFIVLALGGSLVLFRFGGYWFSPVLLVAGALAGYPLWSWRRLEAANRHLSIEMRRTAESFGWTVSLPAAAANRPAGWLEDRFAWQLAASERAADALRHSRRILAESFAGLPIGVIVCDRREQKLFSNPLADLLLSPPYAAEGGVPAAAPVAELLAHLGRNSVGEWRALLDATYRQAAVSTREIQSGQSHYLVTVAPYALVDEIVVGAIVALADITAVRRLEREREELMQFVSHDLRSPQNSIIAAAQLARDDPGSFAGARLSTLVEGYAQQTLALIDTLLALTRAERLVDADLTEVDLASVAQDAVDDAWPQASARGQRIELRLPAAPATVRGRGEILARAILNLLTNAMKFGPPKSVIDVSIERVGERWRVSVRDDGPGIPPDSMPRLFERFYRVPRGRDADPGGTGLGLAFVKTVATKLGGEAMVHSIPGAGATFSIDLPVG